MPYNLKDRVYASVKADTKAALTAIAESKGMDRATLIRSILISYVTEELQKQGESK